VVFAEGGRREREEGDAGRQPHAPGGAGPPRLRARPRQAQSVPIPHQDCWDARAQVALGRGYTGMPHCWNVSCTVRFLMDGC